MLSDVDCKILEELKRGHGHVSGEWLAARFSITRQALWKHISKLDALGYQIVAVPHLGYKLTAAPDKLYPWEIKRGLKSKVMGREIRYHQSIDSTQNEAWKLGLQNASEGTVVLSERQIRGRGRMSRRWISACGGIYFSLLLRPRFVALEMAPQITLLVALGCLYGIREATGLVCSLKWPNDVFLNGKKLSGILCEISSDTDRINFVIAGVGINVNTKDLPPAATSLFLESQEKMDRTFIIRTVLEHIENCYNRVRQEGFGPLLREWESFCFLWGHEVKVRIFEREINGVARGIDERGYLLLETAPRRIERIYAGDVIKVN